MCAGAFLSNVEACDKNQVVGTPRPGNAVLQNVNFNGPNERVCSVYFAGFLLNLFTAPPYDIVESSIGDSRDVWFLVSTGNLAAIAQRT